MLEGLKILGEGGELKRWVKYLEGSYASPIPRNQHPCKRLLRVEILSPYELSWFLFVGFSFEV